MARPRSDIRARILTSARSLFLRAGVEAASLRAIADDAGTSIGMIYYYFATKDALFLASIEDPLGALARDLEACVDPSVAASDRIDRLHARVRSLGELESVAVRIVLREALVSRERLDALRPALSPFVVLFARAVDEARESGALRTDVAPASLALALFGTSVAAPIAAALAGLGPLDLSAIFGDGARAR